MSKADYVVILSADECVCIFVLFVVKMRCPAQGSTGGWVMSSLVFQWFLRVSSHYLILPRVSSLEKAMASHSSTLTWKILWLEEPGGLQSMGSLRVRHD